jgi:hypothetical protein
LEVIVGSKSWAHCPYWGMVIKPFNFSHYKGHQYGIYDQTTYLLMYIPWPWHVWFSQVLAPLYLGCPLLGVSWIHWGLPPRLAIWTWGIPERLRHRFRGHLPLNCFKHPKKIDDMCIYIYTQLVVGIELSANVTRTYQNGFSEMSTINPQRLA